jgi:NADPH-dependent ferric siderophore reductase
MWLHRGSDPSQAGVLTMNLIETLAVPDDAYWWIAGERDAIRAMRDVVVEDRGVPRDRLSLNAHWRLRATDPR